MVDEENLHDDIDPKDVDDGKVLDDEGIPYDPDAGSTSPTEHRCNALLNKWRQRYGEPRYCQQCPMGMDSRIDVDHDFCEHHKGHATIETISAEKLTHGISTKTREHFFDKLDVHKQVYAYGVFESLMGDSEYEFAPEYDNQLFDFSEAPFTPDIADKDDRVLVQVPHATQYKDREIALLAAAIDSIKMMDAQSIIAESRMRTKETSEAEFTTATVVGEGGGGTPKSWQTIEEYTEHYLNLVYSRLVRDRASLLEYGGIETDADQDGTDVAITDLDALTEPEPDFGTDTPINDRVEGTDIEIDRSV